MGEDSSAVIDPGAAVEGSDSWNDQPQPLAQTPAAPPPVASTTPASTNPNSWDDQPVAPRSQYGLEPDFNARVNNWSQAVKDRLGLDVAITEGYRDPKRSDQLRASGVIALPGGQSYHNYGQAFDYGFKTDKGIDLKNEKAYTAAGEIAKEYGISPISNESGHLQNPNFQIKGAKPYNPEAPNAQPLTSTAQTTTGESWDDQPVAHGYIEPHLTGGLKGHGADFEAAGQKYGVDPFLLVAMSQFETGNGTSSVLKSLNNTGGITGKGHSGVGSDYRPFATVGDSIDEQARLIADYQKQGLTTIPQIGAKWAPGGGVSNDPNNTNREWPSAVTANYKRMTGNTSPITGQQQTGESWDDQPLAAPKAQSTSDQLIPPTQAQRAFPATGDDSYGVSAAIPRGPSGISDLSRSAGKEGYGDSASAAASVQHGLPPGANAEDYGASAGMSRGTTYDSSPPGTTRDLNLRDPNNPWQLTINEIQNTPGLSDADKAWRIRSLRQQQAAANPEPNVQRALPISQRAGSPGAEIGEVRPAESVEGGYAGINLPAVDTGPQPSVAVGPTTKPSSNIFRRDLDAVTGGSTRQSDMDLARNIFATTGASTGQLELDAARRRLDDAKAGQLLQPYADRAERERDDITLKDPEAPQVQKDAIIAKREQDKQAWIAGLQKDVETATAKIAHSQAITPGPEYQKTIPGIVSRFIGDNVPFLAASLTGPFAPAVMATQMSESAYSQEYDKALVAARKAHPDWTEEQLQDVAHKAGTDAAQAGFENGLVMSFLHIPKLGGPITSMLSRLGIRGTYMMLSGAAQDVEDNIATKKYADPSQNIYDGIQQNLLRNFGSGVAFEFFPAAHGLITERGLAKPGVPGVSAAEPPLPHRAPLERFTEPAQPVTPPGEKKSPVAVSPAQERPPTEPQGGQRAVVVEENGDAPPEQQPPANSFETTKPGTSPEGIREPVYGPGGDEEVDREIQKQTVTEPASAPITESIKAARQEPVSPVTESINAVRPQPTIVDPNESKAARNARLEYEQEMAGVAKEGQPELLSEIQQAGGLPTVQKLRNTPGENLTGELNRVYDAWKALDQDTKNWLKKQGITPSKLFRHDAPGLDVMRDNLSQVGGFSYDLPHEMLGDIENAIQMASDREKFLGQRYTAEEPVEFQAGLKFPKLNEETRQGIGGNIAGIFKRVINRIKDIPNGHGDELAQKWFDYHNERGELSGQEATLNKWLRGIGTDGSKERVALSKEVDAAGHYVADNNGRLPPNLSQNARDWIKMANGGLLPEIGARMRKGGFDVRLANGRTRPFIGAPAGVPVFLRIMRPDVRDVLNGRMTDVAGSLTPKAKAIYDEGRRTIDRNTGQPFFKKPQDLLDWAKQWQLNERRGPMESNLEKARELKFPSFFYTYSPEATMDSISRQIPEIARLNAFGQKLKGPDLFDRTVERVSQDTRLTGARRSSAVAAIKDMQRDIYGLNKSGPIGRVWGGVTSAGFAGSIKTSGKILVSSASGFTFAPYRGLLRSLGEVVKYTIGKGMKQGELRSLGLSNDIFTNISDDPRAVTTAQQKSQNIFTGTLRIAGHSMVMDIARKITAGVSKSWAQMANRRLMADPTFSNSKNRQIANDIRSRGIDPKVFTQPLDQKMLERWVREDTLNLQTSYRPGMYPGWTSTEPGRFVNRFGHWAENAANVTYHDAIEPFVKALRQDPVTGKRDLPLAGRYAIRLAAIAAGQVLSEEALRAFKMLFGDQSNAASIGEIWKAFSTGNPAAAHLLLGRLGQDITMGPVLGIFGDVYRGVTGVLQGKADTTHVFNPATPAGVAYAQILVDLANHMSQQGGKLSERQIRQTVNNLAGIVKGWVDIANTAGVPMPKTLITGSHATEIGRRETNFVKDRLDLFYQENQQFPDKRPKGSGFAGNTHTPYLQNINDALLAGDAPAVRAEAQKMKRELKLNDKQLATSLRESANSHRPIPGGTVNAPFIKWAKNTLTPDELARMHTINRKYEQTAKNANINLKESD